MDTRSSYGVPKSAAAIGHGGKISSAAELPVNRLCADYTVDGSNTISRLTPLPVGQVVTLYFTGAPTIANSATLICPGNANVAFAAGDAALLRSSGSGIWQLLCKFPALSLPLLAANNLSEIPNRNVARGNIGVISPPQGRLTLTSGVASMASSVAGATAVYYTPACGQQCPIYDGTKFVMTDLGGELSQATSDTTKSPAAVAPETVYDLYVWNDAGTPRCTRGAAWSYASTVTISIASPAVVSWAGHGLPEGAPVVFSTTGALPTGLTAGTTYYVGRSPGTNSLNLATSVANAAAGTFVNTSGSQSGIHTANNGTTQRGAAAAIAIQNGIAVNSAAITNGPGATLGTLVGSVRSNASSTIDFIFGTAAAGGGASFLNVANLYNQVLIKTKVSDSTASYPYALTAGRAANASVGNRVSFVQCLPGNAIDAVYRSLVQLTGSGNFVNTGFALNSTTGMDVAQISFNPLAATNLFWPESCGGYSGLLGSNYIQATEGTGGATVTFLGGPNSTYGSQQITLEAAIWL